MRISFKKFLATTLALGVVLIPAMVFADNDPIGATIENPIKVDTLNGFLKVLLEGIIKIGIPLVALAIIYSGFMFVSARGKPEALKKAKDAFLYSLVGAAVLLGAWTLAQLISDTVLELSFSNFIIS